MKNLTLLFLLFISTFSHAQSIEKISLYSEILNQDRDLLIYKPSDFYYYPTKRFEVIYVFDAQNRETFDFVHSSIKFINPPLNFIVVGIQSPYIEIEDKVYGRNDDMLPKAMDRKTKEKYFGAKSNGNAANFRKFIDEEVFPFIENSYRTLPLRVAIGHSNSATFTSYCFLKRPEMFDAYLIQSPNFGYDKNQLVEMFKKFNFNTIEHPKFLFLSNANESTKTGWKGWKEAREEIYLTLKNKKSDKLHFEIKQYPNSSHLDSFIKSSVDGLKSFINYQFRTGENIISYYESLANKKLISLNPENTNKMAYECFYAHKAKDALKVIEWALTKFSNDANLYDSRGEFLESIGHMEQARNSYFKAIEILKSQQKLMSKDDFKERLKVFEGNYNRVK